LAGFSLLWIAMALLMPPDQPPDTVYPDYESNPISLNGLNPDGFDGYDYENEFYYPQYAASDDVIVRTLVASDDVTAGKLPTINGNAIRRKTVNFPFKASAKWAG
jgi:hypothetical protein